jgi:hypothetical protein
MPIPVLTLRGLIDTICTLGNSGILLDFEHPDVRSLKKVFPAGMTDAQKSNDRSYNDFIANQKAVSMLLIKLWRAAIDERNQALFTKEQLEKDLIQLMEVLKEKAFYQKLKENGEQEAYLARLKDRAFAEEQERKLAMEEFVKALNEQNKILFAKRKEHVDTFVNTMIPLLHEIEPFSHLTHEESSDLLRNAFEEALVIDKDFDVKAANIQENANGNGQQHVSGQNLPSNGARVLTFAHNGPAGIEVQRKAAIKGVFAKLAQHKFIEKGIDYTKEDVERGATIFHESFTQAKIPVKEIDEEIKVTRAAIEMVKSDFKLEDMKMMNEEDKSLLGLWEEEPPSQNTIRPPRS